MIQKTQISISGGGVPLVLVILIIIVAILVIGLIVWLFRGVRKNINADDEWRYDEYSLMKAGIQTKVETTEEPPTSEPMLASEPEITEPAPVKSVEGQSQPEPRPSAQAPAQRREPMPPPVQAPRPLPKPMPPKVTQPAPTARPEPIQPVGPPSARFTRPVAMPEETVAAEEGTSVEPSTPQPVPRSSEPFFQSYEYEAKQEHRRRAARLAVAGVIILLVVLYFTVFPVQDAINSAVASLGQRLGQLLKSQPASQEPLATLPQLDIVQEVAPRNPGVVITGRVRNISSDTLSNLFVEIALVPVGVELAETRLVPIQPATLAPNQEGKYSLEIRTDQFSKYQLARILTANKKEVTFKLSMAFPSSWRQQ